MSSFLHFLGQILVVIMSVAVLSLPITAMTLLVYVLLIRRPLHWVSLRLTLKRQKEAVTAFSEEELAEWNRRSRQAFVRWLSVIGLLACCLLAMLCVSHWQGDMTRDDVAIVLFLLCVAVVGLEVARCFAEQLEDRISFRAGRVQQANLLSGVIHRRKKVVVQVVDSRGDVFGLVMSRARYERYNRKSRNQCFVLCTKQRLFDFLLF
jgi:hypothetical protein